MYNWLEERGQSDLANLIRSEMDDEHNWNSEYRREVKVGGSGNKVGGMDGAIGSTVGGVNGNIGGGTHCSMIGSSSCYFTRFVFG